MLHWMLTFVWQVVGGIASCPFEYDVSDEMYTDVYDARNHTYTTYHELFIISSLCLLLYHRWQGAMSMVEWM